MTSIIYDRKKRTMFADSQATCGDVKSYKKKIFKHRGCLLGFGGALSDVEILLDWFYNYQGELTIQDLRASFAEIDSFGSTVSIDGCIVTPKNEVIQFLNTELVLCRDRYYYAGSGHPYMVAAIELKKGAVEAIQLACKLDLYSGQPIQKEVL